MTEQQSTNGKAGLTIAGITAVLAMIASQTAAIDYLRTLGAEWIHWPQLRAIVLGVAIGVAFSAWVPYVIPAAACKERAQTLMRFGASVLTFAACWRMQPTELGLYYALIAGMAGTSFYMTTTRWIYRAFPSLQPPALRTP